MIVVAALALPPDAVTEWFKQRKTQERHQAEPQGSVQQPQFLGYLGEVRHLQAAAVDKEGTVLQGLPRLEARRIGSTPFCAPHFLGERACAACTAEPSVRRRAKRHNKAHLLFLNTQKTGGSALECATEGSALASRWTNMGHTTQEAVAACMSACTFGGRAPKVLVMVRDPYDFCAPLTDPRGLEPPTSTHSSRYPPPIPCAFSPASECPRDTICDRAIALPLCLRMPVRSKLHPELRD